MNISMPPSMRAWVQQRVAEGDFTSVSEYIRELVRKDQAQWREIRRIDGMLDDAIAAADRGEGEIIKDLNAWAEERKAEVRRRLRTPRDKPA